MKPIYLLLLLIMLPSAMAFDLPMTKADFSDFSLNQSLIMRNTTLAMNVSFGINSSFWCHINFTDIDFQAELYGYEKIKPNTTRIEFKGECQYKIYKIFGTEWIKLKCPR